MMLALLPTLAGCLAGLAITGLGSGLLDVAPAAMIGDLLRGRGGTLVASYQMAGDAGSVTGPVGAGLLVDGKSQRRSLRTERCRACHSWTSRGFRAGNPGSPEPSRHSDYG